MAARNGFCSTNACCHVVLHNNTNDKKVWAKIWYERETSFIIIISQSVLRLQRVQTPSWLRVDISESVRGPLTMLGEQNGDPPKSQTYPLYEHIWWYKQDKAKRDCTMPLPKCTLPGKGQCHGVISQQVRPVVPVTIPEQWLLFWLLEQRITWPDQILRTHQSPLSR